MIRLLGPGDEARVLAFLDRDHATNLILISDIVEYGMDNRGHIFHGDYYGSFRGEELRGAAAFFNFGSMFLHAEGEDAAAELSRHLAGLAKTPRYFTAREQWAVMFVGEMEKRGIVPDKLERQELLALTREEFEPRGAGGGRARFARPEDLEAVMDLQRGFQLEYFGISTELEEELGRMAVERMAGDGIVVAEVGGEVVAKVEAVVRTRRMGLIGGVYTRPEQRGRGLAGECMSLLCDRLLEGYEAAVLNVALSNQPALRIYRGLGFRHVADYRMAVFP
jgi:uncharacterized protein